MQSKNKGPVAAICAIVVGVAGFFLFLYLTGHDPDERPLTLFEWVLAGILVGPGFGLLLKWRRAKER